MTEVKFDPRNFNADHSGLKSCVWALDLLEGETFADCLKPDAFSRVVASRTPKQGDIVNARSHDRTNMVAHIVLDVGRGWLKLRAFQECVRPDVVLPETSVLNIKWNVGKRKYDVVRRADNTVLKDGFSLKEDAAEWIDNHAKAMAA